MHSRAGLSRTVTPVVALSLMAVPTGVVAWAFGAADSNSAGTITSSISGNVRFEAAMAGNHARAQHDAAAARLIEPIRKVE